MSKIIDRKFLVYGFMLGGLVLPMAPTATNKVLLHATNPIYERLISNLKLTTDASRPSTLVSDEAFRSSLQSSLIHDTLDTRCTSFRAEGLEVGQGHKLYLANYTLASGNEIYSAILRVPDGPLNLPMVLYAHSGFLGRANLSEAETILARNIEQTVVAMPIFFGEEFLFSGKKSVASGRKEINDLFAETKILYGLARCMQTDADKFVLNDTKPLSEKLQKGFGASGGFRMALVGAGRGGLLVAQAAAMTGANMLGGKTTVSDVPHIDAVVQINALQSLTTAENRLWLANMLAGTIAETRYGAVPGVAGFSNGLVRLYRAGAVSDVVMTLEVAKRDANILSPFVNLGVKNYAFPPNTKGLRAGAMLTVQSKNRTDFTANASRVFANVMTTVNFVTTTQTNGMNFHYREFWDDEKEALDDSFQEILSQSFLTAKSQEIDDIFIVLTSRTRDFEKFYKWMMRGRAFAIIGENKPAGLVRDFLATTTGAK